MIRLLSFLKPLLKKSKRGEIATLLIVASLAIAAIGAFVGSQQKKTDTTRTNAQGVYPPFPTEEAMDNTDNNPLVTYLETDGDCTVRIRVVRDPGIWVELSNGSGDSTRFYVAQLNGINSSNRSATLDWRPSVPNNQILIRTINPGTSTRYLPRPDWLGRGPTYIRWVYSMKTSPSDPDPRVFYKLQTVNGCRDSVPPTQPPTSVPSCTPGSPSCPFSPTPTSCNPGSPACPFSPTPSCTPGSGTPGCPRFTPTPTTCTPGSPSCPFSPTPTCVPGSGMPGCPAFTPTPTTCTPGSPACPFSPTPTRVPTPTCTPGSGMPGCPAFTPTPTVCPVARSAPFIIGYDNTNISEYSIAGTSGNISWGPLSFSGAQSRSLGGGRKLWFFPHSNIQVPGSMDSTIHLRRNGTNLDNDASIVAFCYTSSEYPVNPNASMPTNVGATNVCRGWYQGVVNVTNRCGSLSTYGWELPRPPVTPTCAPGSGMPGCPRFTPTPATSRNSFQIDISPRGGANDNTLQCWTLWNDRGETNIRGNAPESGVNCSGSANVNASGSELKVRLEVTRAGVNNQIFDWQTNKCRSITRDCRQRLDSGTAGTISTGGIIECRWTNLDNGGSSVSCNVVRVGSSGGSNPTPTRTSGGNPPNPTATRAPGGNVNVCYDAGPNKPCPADFPSSGLCRQNGINDKYQWVFRECASSGNPSDQCRLRCERIVNGQLRDDGNCFNAQETCIHSCPGGNCPASAQGSTMNTGFNSSRVARAGNLGVEIGGSTETLPLELFTKMDSDGSKNIGVSDFFSWLRAFAAGDTAKCDFNADGKCRVDDATLMFKYMGTTK